MGDFTKPLYEDYKKQAWGELRGNRLVYSRERLYEFADRPLIMFLYIVICAALFSLYFFMPKPDNIVYKLILYSAFIIIGVVCATLYRRRFVYRFARFKVSWEDWSRSEAACEGCDERGNFLPTKENRAAKVRSRFAFLSLFLAILAAAVLFYIFTWGMAEQRVKNSGQLKELALIAEKQGNVSIDIRSYSVLAFSSDGESFIEISREDEKELKRLFEELQWNYVKSLMWENGALHVSMYGWFQHKSFDVYFGQQ